MKTISPTDEILHLRSRLESAVGTLAFLAGQPGVRDLGLGDKIDETMSEISPLADWGDKHESVQTPGLFYWVELGMFGVGYVVMHGGIGMTPKQAWPECIVEKTDADQVARRMAARRFIPRSMIHVLG